MVRITIINVIVLGLLVMFGNAEGADLQQGMVLYYSFDGDSDEEIIDLSPNGNNGAIQGGAKIVPGKFEKGLEVDGTSQFVLIPYNESMDVEDGVTMACWIRVDDPGAACWLYYVISKWNYHAGDGRCYFIGLLDGAGMTFYLSSNGTDAGFAKLDGGVIEYGIDKWQHIAGTFDGSDLVIYIDGEEVGNLSWNNDIFAHNEGMSIGAGSLGKETAAMFTGVIDEVVVYNRGLSEGEIDQLVAAPLGAAVDFAGKLATTWGDVKLGCQ